MAPSLEQVFTLRLYRNAPDTLALASNTRIITPYSSGFLRSNTINATLLSGSCNTLTVAPDGTTHLDARVHFRDSPLNAAFSVNFSGVAEIDDLIQKILERSPDARTTESKEHYEFCFPVFKVSREEDRWMESTAWVGHGHYVVEWSREDAGEMDVAIEFEVYMLVTG